MKKPQPQSILFICQLNSVRSPMAVGLMRKNFPSVADIRSCGLEEGELDDFMVTVMREKGIDMSDHHAMELSELQNTPFEYVIAFTEDAFEAAKAVSTDDSTQIELWKLPNPGDGSLDVRALLDNYRALRDNIEARLLRKFEVAE